MLPDYFFEVAASSTGKYHPKYALGDGGLIRHTKAAVFIAKELLSIEMYSKFTDDEKDLIIVSLILHDGLKHGEDKSAFTVAEHPVIVANWLNDNTELSEILPAAYMEILTCAISSHMGQWNTDYKTKKEILPKPKTSLQKFVHQADYLASRKYLEFNFEDNYYKTEDYIINDTTEKPIDELKETLAKIVDICKTKIEMGIDNNRLYSLIMIYNNNRKNPNSITDLSVAKELYEKLEEIV